MISCMKEKRVVFSKVFAFLTPKHNFEGRF